MIRVVKPPNAPAVLQNAGRVAMRKLCDAFDLDASSYRKGSKTFNFSRDIYAEAAVKNALRKAQRDKCAFCESKFTHTGYGDVEHFRPKGGYKQRETDELRQPGYYWLAYEWANLFLSCQICNQRFKRNLFPLRRQGSRAKTHHDDINLEEPLLIDPSTNPERYLTYRAAEARPRARRREGKATIEVIGLNRPELLEIRRDRLAVLSALKDVSKLLVTLVAENPTPEAQQQLADVRQLLKESVAEDAEYASMARALLG